MQQCPFKFSLLLAALGVAIAMGAPLAFAGTAPEVGPEAAVVSSLRSEIPEASGLDARRHAGATELLIVGDEASEVGHLSVDQAIDNLLPTNPGASQWEAIATDGAGRALILEESPGKILAFDVAHRRRLQTITLLWAGLADGNGDGDNSLGEGLLLLKGGHVLVVKEKDPPLLVEFGPKGDVSLGVTPATLLPPETPFALTSASAVQYHPLRVWSFNQATRAAMRDFSEIAVGPGPTLYLLSEKSARIGRLAWHSLAAPSSAAAVNRIWDLPLALERPEGLAFIGGAPVVACDRKDVADNLFFLAPLD